MSLEALVRQFKMQRLENRLNKIDGLLKSMMVVLFGFVICGMYAGALGDDQHALFGICRNATEMVIGLIAILFAGLLYMQQGQIMAPRRSWRSRFASSQQFTPQNVDAVPMARPGVCEETISLAQ